MAHVECPGGMSCRACVSSATEAVIHRREKEARFLEWVLVREARG